MNPRLACHRTSCRIVTLLIANLFCIHTIPSGAIANHSIGEIRKVAFSGEQAPGTLSESLFHSFDPPAINIAGQAVFRASLAGSSVDATNNNGVWSERSGSLALVAKRGNGVPGAPGAVSFNNFLNLNINDAGQVAFRGILDGEAVDATNNDGMWSEATGNLALVARKGSPAQDGMAGENFNGPFFFGSINSAGQTAFRAGFAGGGVTNANREGIWSEGGGNLSLVARLGDQAPGAPSGVHFSEFHDPPPINENGHIVFGARLTGSGFTEDFGIWSNRSGSLEIVVRSRDGTHAPGTPDGVSFTGFPNGTPIPHMNASGQTAFAALLGGPGVNSSNDQGIWSEGSGNLALVARNGDPAPGTPLGVEFSSFTSNGHVFNDNGKTAFLASLTGPGVGQHNNEGVWSEGFGSLELVARKGSQAADLPPGILYTSVGSIVMNQRGQTLFYAGLAGRGVTNSSSQGIWATDLFGNVRLVLRTGELLEVNPGDFRALSSIAVVSLAGNGDGRPRAMNNLGQIGFKAEFVDGSSGIFVSNLVAVPEPTTFASFVIASLCIAAMPRIVRGRNAARVIRAVFQITCTLTRRASEGIPRWRFGLV